MIDHRSTDVDVSADKIRVLEAENKKLKEEVAELKARLERRELLHRMDKEDGRSRSSRKRAAVSPRPQEKHTPAETLLFNEAERLICQARNKKICEVTHLPPATVARTMVDKYINRVPLVTQARAHEKTQEQEQPQELPQLQPQPRTQPQSQPQPQPQSTTIQPTAIQYTLAKEMLRYTDVYLQPMYQLLRRYLLQENLLFTRETPTKMMEEPYRTVERAARMRVFQTERNARHPIVLYDYRPSRPGQGLTSFLEQYKGYLQVQCHSEIYEQPAITAVSCWSNARSKLNEAIKITGGEDAAWLDKGMEYCNRIFKLDHSFHNFPSEKRYKSRLQLIKPITDEFYKWIQKNRNARLTHFGTAIQYLSTEWPYLMNLFRDGRFELTVNCMNTLIKPFVIGRKNWCISDNSLGAEAGTIIYTIIETARVNNLEPYDYICYLFDHLPTEKALPEAYQPFLPWHVTALKPSS